VQGDQAGRRLARRSRPARPGEALTKVFIEQPSDTLIVWLADYLPVLANVATREDLMRELVKRILLWKFTMLRINYFQ
jgi:hypothetical protein